MKPSNPNALHTLLATGDKKTPCGKLPANVLLGVTHADVTGGFCLRQMRSFNRASMTSYPL